MKKPLMPKLTKPTTVMIDLELLALVKAAQQTKPKKLKFREVVEHGLRLFLEERKK